MKKENILFIGPHPDDVFIACGGFILKNIDKYNFHICCMATKDLSPSSATRLSEEKKTWGQISDKIKIILFEKGKDTKLQEDYKFMVSFIETIVSGTNFRYIFTPYYEDTHQDHIAVSRATLSACRYMKNTIFFETPSTYNFIPTIFVELSEEVMKEKKEISKNYASQILGTDIYSCDLQTIIESKAISNGTATRTCKYAEGFKAFRVFL